MFNPRTHYPKSYQNRLHGSHSLAKESRNALTRKSLASLAIMQVVFLGLFAYLFGAIYKEGQYVHNLNIVYVDYDNGLIGSSVRAAYQKLQADRFPSLQERTDSDYPAPADLRRAVCKTDYWAALYVSPGASSRLQSALVGGVAAASYNDSDILTYIWNEARYPTIVDSSISASLQTLSEAARIVYSTESAVSGSLNLNNSAAISVFANPWTISSVNLQPTIQGARLVYNTLVIILILIQEFFYLGAINGLSMQLKIYARLFPHRIIISRNLISLTYTLCGSLCTTGMIWAFRSGWDVNGNQFALTWAILWLFAHVNFLSLDVLTIWLPPAFGPLSLITWVVFNVSSILVPFELSPSFYWWAYAIPAHGVFQVLIDIWSRGCNPKLYYALPVLFSLEIAGLILSSLGVYRRCHYAVLAEEGEEKAFRARHDALLKLEREKQQETNETTEGLGTDDSSPAAVAIQRNGSRQQEELAEEIERQATIADDERDELGKICSFGPSF
jgi:hypothetical protein